MLDLISQYALTFLSITSIILIARKNKWGFVVGLTSQPFWLITSYLNHQWGVFILSFVYIGTWSYGIYEWFWKKEKVY